ncbi:hypothetical protein K488DRAFT_40180 [Vararia minispora EC-137]|uniref:Uncharacterized protein n=1 Tax=Vararia minispora EC-137 TaxID=1314806 RepID=A0ACB8QYK1_9AGAM|nr:hypothetical protein K488DRAFT_40180 [Vararia minispora EC-137]
MRPPIWAQSRQEVCESLEYFKSYQSGVYYVNDVAQGYLLGAYSSSRDMFHHDGRLIVSHGGGKSEGLRVNKDSGQMEISRASHQSSDDKSVRALLNTYRRGLPLVLLADDKYALFPYDLCAEGYAYIVLGHYWIAEAWAELEIKKNEEKLVRYKFAFQWCPEQGEPWWTLPQDRMANTLAEAVTPARMRCDTCTITSVQVYEQGWMCLNPACIVFFTLRGTNVVEELTAALSFLSLRQNRPYKMSTGKESTLPAPPPAGEVDRGLVTTRRFTRGMHCVECGRLSCRFRWKCWQCQGCKNEFDVKGAIRKPNEFWSQHRALIFSDERIMPKACINRGLQRMFLDEITNERLLLRSYTMPGNRGIIYIIPGNQKINCVADQIFHDYQEQAMNGTIDFRRYPLRSVGRGELLTNYFSQNSESVYLPSFECYSNQSARSAVATDSPQYVGGATRTISLEHGPSVVRDALTLVKRRIKVTIGKDVPFNEVLSAAYMEEQKMAGDILVMDGAGVQEFYEHTVIPMNFRMVATCRVISPENYT